MKTIISIRTLVLSFFLISIYSVTYAGCLQQEVPRNHQILANNYTVLRDDTTITQKDIISPSNASDSLLQLFRFLAKGALFELIEQYPVGYAVLTLNNGRYTSMAFLSEKENISINLKGSVITGKYGNEMAIVVNELQMENMTLNQFVMPFTLDYNPTNVGIMSASMQVYTQLLLKTEAGIMVLIGFRKN